MCIAGVERGLYRREGFYNKPIDSWVNTNNVEHDSDPVAPLLRCALLVSGLCSISIMLT
jgi:hypothetical protein